MNKILTVTNEYFTIKTKVDRAIYKQFELYLYNWYAQYVCGTMKIYTYVKKGKRTKFLYLHRLITACPKNKVVDHIDGDGLNNTLKNLRICSRSKNCLNKGRSKTKEYSSKYLGVSWDGRIESKPWRAHCSHNNKSLNLGYFASEKEAARVRDQKVLKLRGKFARLNFPHPGA